MRVGMALPLFPIDGGTIDADHFARGARAIEAAGFDSIWVFDAVGRGLSIPDPLMALSVATTVTQRVALGTGVLQLPIRNTVEAAYRVLTLHLLCGDRLLLGVGPGSTEKDFLAFGAAYADRMHRFEAQLPDFVTLLRKGRLGDVNLAPWPAAAGGPPVLVAAWRGGWVERAAREFDGWVASAANADDESLASSLARYREAGGERAVVTNVQLEKDLGPGLERMRRLADMGFDDVVTLDLAPSEARIASVAEALGRA